MLFKAYLQILRRFEGSLLNQNFIESTQQSIVLSTDLIGRKLRKGQDQKGAPTLLLHLV